MLVVFAGCAGNSSKDDNKNTAPATAEQSAQEQETTEAPKEVELVTWDDSWSNDPAWDTFMKDLYSDFHEKYPHIKVTRINASKGGPDGGSLNIVAALAAGEGPDVMDWVDIQTFAARGYIAPLDEYLENWPEAKELNQDILNACKYNGKIYALPAMTHLFTPRIIYYRKDIAQEIGLDINNEPQTWAEFKNWVDKFAEHGLKTAITMNDEKAKNFIIANGSSMEIVNPDGTLKCNLNSPENIKLFTWLQSMRDNLDITALIDNQEANDKFVTGKVAMYTASFGEIYRYYIPSGMKDEEIGTFPYPGENGPKACQLLGGRSAINANRPKEVKDAAFELLRFFRADKDNLVNKIWPFLKQVDYRPMMLCTFPDLQEENFKILGVDTKYVEEMKSLLINPKPPLDVGYGDTSPYVNAAFQAIIIQNADVKTELDKAAEAITKNLIEPTNNEILKGN